MAVFNKPLRWRRAASFLNIKTNDRHDRGGHQSSFRVMRGTIKQALAYCNSRKYCRRCSAGQDFTTEQANGCCTACQCADASEKGYQEGTAVALGTFSFVSLDELPEMIISGDMSMNSLAVHHPRLFMRARHLAEHIVRDVAPVSRPPPCVVWFHGPSGSGKSRAAGSILNSEQVFWWGTSSKWADGLSDDKKLVVFDDVGPEFAPGKVWLRLLDRTPLRVEVKGGFRAFKPFGIIVTTLKKPADFWDDLNQHHRSSEPVAQLLRRLSFVVQFPLPDAQRPGLIARFRHALNRRASGDYVTDAPVAWRVGQDVPAINPFDADVPEYPADAQHRDP